MATPIGIANSRGLTCGRHGSRDGRDGADGEKCRSPTGQDSGAEERNAEEEAAGEEGESGDLEQDLQGTDVTGWGATDGCHENVVDIVR